VQNDMHHFVAADKPGFVGRDAVQADRDRGAASKLVMLEVAATTSDASGFEPVYLGERTVGYVTSGGFGHRTQKSLALAYIDTADISPDATYEVPLVGVRHPARLLVDAPFDPSGSRMRS
jgi:dimethylglycine dehydrogenase